MNINRGIHRKKTGRILTHRQLLPTPFQTLKPFVAQFPYAGAGGETQCAICLDAFQVGRKVDVQNLQFLCRRDFHTDLRFRRVVRCSKLFRTPFGRHNNVFFFFNCGNSNSREFYVKDGLQSPQSFSGPFDLQNPTTVVYDVSSIHRKRFLFPGEGSCDHAALYTFLSRGVCFQVRENEGFHLCAVLIMLTEFKGLDSGRWLSFGLKWPEEIEGVRGFWRYLPRMYAFLAQQGGHLSLPNVQDEFQQFIEKLSKRNSSGPLTDCSARGVWPTGCRDLKHVGQSMRKKNWKSPVTYSRHVSELGIEWDNHTRHAIDLIHLDVFLIFVFFPHLLHYFMHQRIYK